METMTKKKKRKPRPKSKPRSVLIDTLKLDNRVDRVAYYKGEKGIYKFIPVGPERPFEYQLIFNNVRMTGLFRKSPNTFTGDINVKLNGKPGRVYFVLVKEKAGRVSLYRIDAKIIKNSEITGYNRKLEPLLDGV